VSTSKEKIKTATEDRVNGILQTLRSLAGPEAVEGMARYGINPKHTLGISAPILRNMAKEIGSDHNTALALWKTGVREARTLAALVDEPNSVTEAQAERWARDLDSWDICDGLCNCLLRKTAFAHSKAVEWSTREEEFVKRAGFVLMACLAVHDKQSPDKIFSGYLPLIKREAVDERNFVKKAVNWALRQIGKRNIELNKRAIKAAESIVRIDSKSARWIARDALRELRSAAVQERLKKKAK
jgi:3-methyladenine DNA glycosylase AlkD